MNKHPAIRAGRERARPRGTTRNPGPDLHRLPIGLDLKGISIAEGVRAALASSIILALNQWIGSVPLLIAATGAMLTCFCDIGGSLRQRLPTLLSFAVLGAATWALFGLLRGLGFAVVVPLAGLGVFLFSMARVWGLRAQTIGNILIVVLALAVDAPLTVDKAAVFFVAFLAGGLWAALLTVVIWRIQPERPALRAVGTVWRLLADLAADMRAMLLRPETTTADWEAHARSHRRAVRAAIEEARLLASDSLRARGLVSGRATQALLLVEAADQLFGEFIILSELLEAGVDAAATANAERVLRRLRPILVVLSAERSPDPARLARSLDRIAAEAASTPQIGPLTSMMIDRLRLAMRVTEGQPPPSLRAATARPDIGIWSGRVWGPLRDELTWRSAILRHAVRATVLTVPALAISLHWWTPYSHWLTITVALTMQPFFAATWQRALERIGGTLLGAAIGAAIAFLPQTPLVVACLLVPLSIVGFSVRQVSYGAYVGCLTPLTVVLFDLVEPGHSAWVVAGMRSLYTVVGGGVAVAACLLLWPSWEPIRLKRELAATYRAYARLAAAILGDPTPTRAEETEEARRAAGLANSNLEASLSRALQEPGRRNRDRLDSVIAADAVLRRLGGSLLAVPHDASVREVLEGPERVRWQAWLDHAFRALADGVPVAEPVPEAPASSTLQRVRRAVELLDGKSSSRIERSARVTGLREPG